MALELKVDDDSSQLQQILQGFLLDDISLDSGYATKGFAKSAPIHTHDITFDPETNAIRDSLFRALHTHTPVPYLHELAGELPDAPSILRDYVLLWLQHGAEEANCLLLDDEIVEADDNHQKYISGDRDRCHRFRSRNMSAFIASLFVHIQLSAPTTTTLCGYDLYHGHAFIHQMHTADDSNGSNKECDFGILFHSKEFPKEYRYSKKGPWYPIGHEVMGGKNDPRIGSTISTHDDDFIIRNYLYIMSTNKIYLIDTLLCPEEMIQNSEFHTISSTFFLSVFDVNYFPRNTDTAVSCPSLQQHMISLRKYCIKEIKQKDGLINALNIMKKDSHWTWTVEQIVHLTNHSFTTTHDDMYICAFYSSGYPPELRLLNALQQVQVAINQMNMTQLDKLSYLMCSNEIKHTTRAQRIPKLIQPYLLSLMEKKKNACIAAERIWEEKELNKLLKDGYTKQHSLYALDKTSSLISKQYRYSAFRAGNLLKVLYREYRKEWPEFEGVSFNERLCLNVLHLTHDAFVTLSVLTEYMNIKKEEDDNDGENVEILTKLTKKAMLEKRKEADRLWEVKMEEMRKKVDEDNVNNSS